LSSLASDQVCPEESLVISSMFRAHIIPGFDANSHVFGVCPRIWHGPQTPRSESSNYASKINDQNREIMVEGQDQNKGITDCKPT